MSWGIVLNVLAESDRDCLGSLSGMGMRVCNDECTWWVYVIQAVWHRWDSVDEGSGHLGSSH